MYRFQYPFWYQDPLSHSPPQQTPSNSLVKPSHPFFSDKNMPKGSQTTSVISALGTLIGYIGSEAATEDVFERLLWPQRFFNAFSWRDILQVGLLSPMGGPMHKAALTTLDTFHHNGLFRGRNQGNMLGTAFFRDTKLRYTGPDGGEYVRNGLWAQAVARIPFIAERGVQSGIESANEPPKLVRARSVVNILELSYADGRVNPEKIIANDVGSLSFRTVLAIIWSEITGLIMGALVVAFWRSYFAFIWFLPLALKLLSASFTIQRDPLLPKPSKKEADLQETKRFEVNTHGQGFLVVEGKESTVLQFFRHYGHPVRNRFRELLQMTIIVTLGFVFPIGLVCSLIWMPIGMQYLWLAYQLYATLALYVYRFTRAHQWATTEARLAQKFAEGLNEERLAYLQDDDGNTVQGKLTRIYVGRYGEGQKRMKEYLAERPSHEEGRQSDEQHGPANDIAGPKRSTTSTTSDTLHE